MAAVSGPMPGILFTNTNGTLRKEIKDDLLDKVTTIASLQRTHDSIAISDNFHLDAKEMGNNYKVDVQYRKGTKGTVAQIMLAKTATSLADAKTGLNGSARDGHIWNVT